MPGSTVRTLLARPGAVASLIVAVAGFYLLVTMPGRGIYWDEQVQSLYGQSVLRWYSSGFEDRSALEEGNLILYGGWIESGLELVASTFPSSLRYTIRHAVVALLALTAILGMYRLGVAVRKPWVGVGAALLLACSPRFMGHAFFNSKDLPFAVLYLWVLVNLAKDLSRPIGARWRSAGLLVMSLGVLMGTRAAGLVILPALLAGYGAQWRQARGGRREAVQLAARFSVVFVGAWGVMLAAWPWAQTRPFSHPLAALLSNGRFPWPNEELFRGRFVVSLELPWSYVPDWFWRTTPELVLVGLLAIGVSLVVRPAQLRALSNPVELALAVGGALPLAYVIMTRAALYDGLRHLMFLTPLVVFAAALGLFRLWSWTGHSRGTRRLRAPVAALGLAGVALPVQSMIALRPYEYVYFNTVSGGLESANGRYELDYWGLSYREGMEWLSRELEKAPGPRRVASCSHPESSRPFLGEAGIYAGALDFGLSEAADYLVFTAAHDCVALPPWVPPAGTVIHQVKRDGVPLLTILRLDEPFRGWNRIPRASLHRPASPTPPESPERPGGSPRAGRSSDRSSAPGPVAAG